MKVVARIVGVEAVPPALLNFSYLVDFLASDGTYSSCLKVQVAIGVIEADTRAAIALAVANAVNAAKGTALLATDVKVF